MTTPAHSPLPWHLEEDCDLSVRDASGFSLGIFSPEDARLIVTAVNAHADLPAAAQEILSMAATRDVRSFVWGSQPVEHLRIAIAKAIENAE